MTGFPKKVIFNNCIKRIEDRVSCLEIITDSNMLGLSGDSKIFNVDMRENQTKINYYHIKEYQTENDEEFQSLSRNKNHSFQFAVGTSYKAMIFDIRQMTEPCYTFAPDLDSLKPRQINVSWSPSGKYIFTHAPILWKYSNDDSPEIGDEPGESISFFWDVQNDKRIGMSVEATSLMEWSSGAQTWIDDNLVVGSLSGVHTTAPNSRTTEHIFERDEHDRSRDPNIFVHNFLRNSKKFSLLCDTNL